MANNVDLTNLAGKINPEFLRDLGVSVVENYDEDINSRAEWSKRRSRWIKLFTGHRDEKNTPWHKASNVNIPILSVAAMQFNARALPSLLPPKDIVKPYAIDGAAINVAKRKAKYLNWQLGYNIENYREEMDRLLIQLPIYGTAYKKTYYDYLTGRIESRTLPVEEVVTPYKFKRFEDCPRITHAFYLDINDIRKRGLAGVFIDTDDFEELSGTTEESNLSTEIIQEVDKYEGITQGGNSERPRLILEQHLDVAISVAGQGSSSKIKDPYVVTVDYETRKVLRVVPRTINGKRIDYFTQYIFMPSPESHYGIGFGHMLEHMNESINTISNQLIDSGTLQNTKGGFISRRGGMKRGELSFVMGEFKELEIPVEDIRKQIFPMEFSAPSQALFNLLNMLQDYSQRVSSVSDTMMGQAPPSDTTATTMMAIMEQGMSMFSTIHSRIHNTLGKELRKIEQWNSIHLDTKKYVDVQDSTSAEFQEIAEALEAVNSGAISPETFEEMLRKEFMMDTDVIPVSNPNITSRAEKLAKAEEVYQMALNNPIMRENPQALFSASEEKLKALEVQNISSYLQQPQPPEPPEDKPPEVENADFLKEVGSEVLPQQDHPAHWESHESFKQSSWYEQLTTHGKKLLDDHMMNTISNMYAKEAAGQEENPIQFNEEQQQQQQEEGENINEEGVV